MKTSSSQTIDPVASLSLFLPSGILDYFTLVNHVSQDTCFILYLEEKATIPAEYSDLHLHSKGFLPEIEVQDFPIRGKAVYLRIKRRRWEDPSTGHLDNHAGSCQSVAEHYCMDGKQLQSQYKDHLSDFQNWDQRAHAQEYILYPKNMGYHLCIDETALSKGDLYTILINRDKRGRKGSIIAVIQGTKADDIIAVLSCVIRSKKLHWIWPGACKRLPKRAFHVPCR